MFVQLSSMRVISLRHVFNSIKAFLIVCWTTHDAVILLFLISKIIILRKLTYLVIQSIVSH